MFTVIKLVVVAGILCGFIGLGLVLGIAKAYIDTTPTLDISALTESDRTSYIYDGNGNMITTFASMEYRDWANIDEIPDNLKMRLLRLKMFAFINTAALISSGFFRLLSTRCATPTPTAAQQSPSSLSKQSTFQRSEL